MKTIGIVNYGLGNIRSIENALLLNAETIRVKVIDHPEDLIRCDALILPGVGAFGHAMEQIALKGFESALDEYRQSGKYLLGICLGMQLLASKSYEHGEFKGLGYIQGEVLPFEAHIQDRVVPHMGWNSVDVAHKHALFTGVENNSDFYFVHSYFFHCSDPGNVLAKTPYGIDFASIVYQDNVIGAQFHPEKSQENGLQLLKNFMEISLC